MHRRYWLYFLLIGFFIFFVWQRQNTSVVTDTSLSVPSSSSNKIEVRVEAEEAKRPEPTEEINSSITKTELNKLRSSLPDKMDVRSEIRENTHQTPDSLISFAKTLGPLMEKALDNPKAADLLIKELDDCLADNDVFVAARTLCLSKAEQLAGVYPQFENNLKNMKASAGEDVRRLFQRKKSLIK